MMFYSDELRVVLATVHVPLAEVPRALTQTLARGRRSRSPRASCRGSARCSRASPSPGSIRTPASTGCSAARRSIAIAPAIARCRAARHRRVADRFPPTRSSCAPRSGEFDVVIACYHDQGLIPVKLLAFGRAVNVTLGLPIIRTSVDHGTAFDIAGKGVADAESMIAAVLLAARLREVRAEGGHWTGSRSHGRRKPSASSRRSNIAENRKAFHDYHLLETFEAGLVLLGTEVKAIREGRVNLRDSFARVENGEVFLYNVNISPYSHRGYADHEPLRRRKLLLHREEIRKLIGKTVEKGMTLVPTRLYFKNGRVKVAVASRRARRNTTSARRSSAARPIAKRARPIKSKR